jgi:UDP-GlcNAc:undecaprenyl-phosphate GlcNAc-1-phosphate transferase
MLQILYLLLFAQAIAVGWILTACALRLAPRLGLVDHPGERKLHAAPKPAMGGVAVYVAFVATLAVDLLIAGALASDGSWVNRVFPVPLANIGLPSVSKELWAILAGSFVVFLVGVIDDRRSLPAGLKLMVQIAATVPLLWAGVRVRGFLPMPLGAAATVLWVVFLTNAFNFLDNMDGLCGGVAAICLGVFAVLALMSRQFFMAAIFVALAGSLAGFLRYNWFPSKIFLGDGGALSVGYLIAALSIHSTYYTASAPTGLPILIPGIVLGVPIFDSLSVYWIRWREGRKLWVGDTSHFSHRLVALGMTRKQAVLFIYLVTLTVGLAALPLMQLAWRDGLIHTGQIALVFLIIAFLEAVGSSDPNRNRPAGR